MTSADNRFTFQNALLIDNVTGKRYEASRWTGVDWDVFTHPDFDRVRFLQFMVESAEEKNTCQHTGEWLHHFDPDAILGDYYTCMECGDLAQVG